MIKTLCKVTVGVPVYNVEKYVENSILSVLEQTYENIEILVVDDCGDDNSMDIVWNLQREHINGYKIKVIAHEKNKGLSAARNTIIENAEGKYIVFLDSDDYLSHDAVGLFCETAEKYETDVVYGSVRDIDISKSFDKPVITFVKLPFAELLGKDEFAKFVNQDIHYHIYVTSWNILFRTNFLKQNGLKFVTTPRGEDILFCSDFYPLVERAVLLPNITYNYIIRNDSLLGRQKRSKINIDEVLIHLRNDDYLSKRCLELRDKIYYDVHCTKVVRYKFSTICAILKHRSQLTGEISNKILCGNLKHPATFREIVHFKKYRSLNLFFYIISKLPSKMAINLVFYIGKYKHYI